MLSTRRTRWYSEVQVSSNKKNTSHMGLIRHRNETWVAFLCRGYDFRRRHGETDARTDPNDVEAGSKSNISRDLAVGERAHEDMTRKCAS